MIDSHCHIDFNEFDVDRDAVLKRAQAVGITKILVPGVERRRWQQQIQLCSPSPMLHFSLGIHPYFLESFEPNDLLILEQLAAASDCIAIGECGIDATVDDIDFQIRLLVRQVEIANRLALPVIIHHRRSHHHIFAAFKTVPPKFGGVIHAFSGSLQDAKKYIKLGFKLGIGGTITYARAQKTIDVLRQISLHDILLETDSPDMPLQGHQGKRNEPRFVVDVAKAIANIKQVRLDNVTAITSQSAVTLFNLD